VYTYRVWRKYCIDNTGNVSQPAGITLTHNAVLLDKISDIQMKQLVNSFDNISSPFMSYRCQMLPHIQGTNEVMYHIAVST